MDEVFSQECGFATEHYRYVALQKAQQMTDFATLAQLEWQAVYLITWVSSVGWSANRFQIRDQAQSARSQPIHSWERMFLTVQSSSRCPV
jgi:hypothetical protein